MKICRTISGISISLELTKEELLEAFSEQQHLEDIKDISNYFDAMDDNKLYCSCGLSRNEVKLLLNEMATLKRHYIILNKDISYEDAIDKAVSRVIKLNLPAIREARGQSIQAP